MTAVSTRSPVVQVVSVLAMAHVSEVALPLISTTNVSRAPSPGAVRMKHCRSVRDVAFPPVERGACT